MIAVLFGAAVFLTWAVSQWSAHDDRKNVDALGVSLMLVVSFILTNVLEVTVGWPDMVVWFPFMDAAFCAMLYFNWRRHPRTWKAVVMASLVAQLVSHFGVTVLWESDQLTRSGTYLYATFINGAFALQLLATGSVGIGHAVGRLFASRRDLRGLAADTGARG